MDNYQKAEKIRMKNHPELDEKWLQRLIAADPAILGLGAVIVRGWEVIQPGAGRLDLLLQSADVDAEKRYEVEIQLGKTDASHIIRTIEYWDFERKRSPQYDHCAVIVAEEITGRFLNVIGLFGGSIPLIALQVTALKVGEHLTLTFTRVVDEIRRGLDDGPDPVEGVDRAYWEERGSKAMLEVTDELLAALKSFDSSLELKYNKPFIGLTREGRANNFVYFIPCKNYVTVCIRLPQSTELDKEIDQAGLDRLPNKDGRYRPQIGRDDLAKHHDLIHKLLEMANKEAVG